MSTLADRIRSEAAIADRPGQMARLEAIAMEVERATHSTGTDTGGPCCQCCYDVQRLPIHRTEAGWPRCATCDGGGCPDCTDPA